MYYGGLAGLIGQDVVAVADGMEYRGRLIEVSESEVFIQSELGWIQLQVSQVTDIRPA